MSLRAAQARTAAASAAGFERAVARVDISAVERNCALLKDRLGRAELCAVVKADGYGHGAIACGRAALAGGATRLAVATAREAVELREHGVEARLLVMGALTAAELEAALTADAEVVAWTRDFVDLAARQTESAGRRARLHVKLDTGMGRLGTKDPHEALELLARIDRSGELEPAGLMTHFATADEPDPEYFQQQLERFAPLAEQARSSYPGIAVHAANSAAVLREPASHFDMARCGIAIYGLCPFHGDPAEAGLEPALSLESYVAAVKRVDAGESIGYGRSWAATLRTNVAVLPIGYGDGYRRGLSNVADVLIGGRRFPVVGTISMDNITVDVGAGDEVELGDRATLIGAQGEERILAEELARKLGTINYEVTCGLSARVPRLHEAGGRRRSPPQPQ
jgi:alanine racemase